MVFVFRNCQSHFFLAFFFFFFFLPFYVFLKNIPPQKKTLRRDHQLAGLERVVENNDGAVRTDIHATGAGAGALGGHGVPMNPATAAKLAKQVCNFWMRGECARGTKCPRAHSTEGFPERDLLRTLHIIGDVGGRDKEAAIRAHFGVRPDPVRDTAATEQVGDKPDNKQGESKATDGGGDGGDTGKADDGENEKTDGDAAKAAAGDANKAAAKSTIPRDSILRVHLRENRAFIEFATRRAAVAAMLANGHGVHVGGKHVKVVWARTNNAGSGPDNGGGGGPGQGQGGKRGRGGVFGPAEPKRKREQATELFPTYDAEDPSNF
jgi:hypothetical protein